MEHEDSHLKYKRIIIQHKRKLGGHSESSDQAANVFHKEINEK